MDARLVRLCLTGISLFASTDATSRAATTHTRNFVVHAPTDEIAQQVGRAAEYYRAELSVEWLGEEMPPWSRSCPIHVRVGQMGASGATTFQFSRGEVFNWNMRVNGPLDRILDSVLPHEVNHTILACHFRRPLPRWADEGAATLCEHESERMRQLKLLDEVIRNRTKFPLRTLLPMTEYPQDMHRVLTLYAQGYSLAEFLVQQGGRKRFLEFLDEAHRSGWDRAVARFYDHDGVDSLENNWQGWFLAGSPRLDLKDGELLADASTSSQSMAKPGLIVRSQSPERNVRTDAKRSKGVTAADQRHASSVRAPQLDPSIQRRSHQVSAGTSPTDEAVRGESIPLQSTGRRGNGDRQTQLDSRAADSNSDSKSDAFGSFPFEPDSRRRFISGERRFSTGRFTRTLRIPLRSVRIGHDTAVTPLISP